MLDDLREGDRVVLQGDHPWARSTGTYIGKRPAGGTGAWMPVVMIDGSGVQVFVFDDDQWKRYTL